MQKKFLNQTEINEALTKLLNNIKRDRSDRKTIDYCKRRMELLETY